MRFYLVLGTEFELSVAVQEGAGPITRNSTNSNFELAARMCQYGTCVLAVISSLIFSLSTRSISYACEKLWIDQHGAQFTVLRISFAGSGYLLYMTTKQRCGQGVQAVYLGKLSEHCQ